MLGDAKENVRRAISRPAMVLLRIIRACGTSAAIHFNFDCAIRGALSSRRSAQEFPMLSVIIGTLMVFSIGVLIAHAMDAFRS
jgi:hypothetical protein